MAGHSQWANIKHRKARQDAKKGKEWSRCAKAIIVAAKQGGGDPDGNITLRYAIDEAKAVNMPKDTIEKAIKKGTGELVGENYEPQMYEGYGPGGVAIIVEALTNNKNRTVGEVRTAFSRHGGNLGTSGSVSFVFTPKGVILIDRSKVSEDRLMELALEAGAEDVTAEEGSWRVTTQPADFHAVRMALRSAGVEADSAELTMVASNYVTCTGDEARKVLNLIEALDDLDDVQKVHANFDIPEEDLAALEK